MQCIYLVHDLLGGVSDTKSNVRFFLFLDKQPGRIDVLKMPMKHPSVGSIFTYISQKDDLSLQEAHIKFD